MSSGNSTTIRFGPPLRDWQREVAQNKARFRVLALHRRAGKTELALKKLLNAAVRATVDLPQFFYVSPYLKQSKAIAWARIKQLVAPLIPFGHVEINEGDLSIRFTSNGALVRIFGADNPDAMRGVRLDGCVLDEVAQIKPETWEDILQPALSDRKGWMWAIGTPSGINMFSELFYKAQADTTGDWWAARYTVHDTDAIDPDEVERLKRDMHETSFAREYLCDFSAAGDNQLISLSDAEAAAHRTVRSDQYGFAARVLGVDPARFGDDRSVIMPRQGLACFEPMVYRGLDNMQLVGHITQKIEAWQPDAVFVDAGAGSGVIDRLRQLGHAVIEVDFGGKPADDRYLNKRAEMWHNMRDWLREGGVIPDINALKLEMATPTYSFNAANRIVLESKDDIKKRLQGGSSPDLADALALTFAHPVAPRPRPLPGRSLTRDRRAYDPFA